MAPNTKKTKRAQGKKTGKAAVVPPQEKQTVVEQLPPYQCIDFSTPPPHLEVINKKIRTVKKKLRRIQDIEQAIDQGSKKVTKEQQEVLQNKVFLERSLADFEEIKKSVNEISILPSLHLLLGIFFGAANTQSAALTDLSTVLLPPGDPPAGYNPHQELQHACQIAEQFLDGVDKNIFDSPPTSCKALQEEVKEFLIPKESPKEVEKPKQKVVLTVAVAEPSPVEPQDAGVEKAPDSGTKEEKISAEAKEESNNAETSTNVTKKGEIPNAVESAGNKAQEAIAGQDSTKKEGQKPYVKNKRGKKNTRRDDRGSPKGRGRGGRVVHGERVEQQDTKGEQVRGERKGARGRGGRWRGKSSVPKPAGNSVANKEASKA